jgi:nucleolar complex protein 3
MAPNGTKRRKLAHQDDGEEASSKHSQKAFMKNAASWNLEQDYESKPRKGSKKNVKEAKPSNRLPIKTADGRIEVLRGLEDEMDSDEDWLEGRDDGDEDGEEAEQDGKLNAGAAADGEEEEEEKPEHEQILEAQEELAKIATAVNESPEDNVGAFRSLAKIGKSRIPAVQMLALMTQLAVYKDVIPGYRIRPLSEESQKEQLSKEVRQLRQYEQSLVTGYQGYVKELSRCARLPSRGQNSLSSVAVTCACTLVTSVPHFNFRGDLLKILVGKLSKRTIDEDGFKCINALDTLFRDDEEGRPTQEAVSLLAKMMKAREFKIQEDVVNLFLSLRLLSEFSGKGSHEAVDAPVAQKMKKKQRDFRTKRERKAVKERKALEKDMDQADAMVNHEETERMQSETLKLVFASYFRILKMRTPHLMGAVLEGLAKYAHLINQDFFGDLLEALKDLIRHSQEDAEAEFAGEDEENAGKEKQEDDDDEDPAVRNLTREALLCTVTAFALLAGQDAHNSRSALHLDLSFFTSQLYSALLSLSMDPELENTKLTTSSSSSTNKINVQTTTVLLLRSLTGVLLPPYNIRSVPPLRLAAFSKQLMTTALQMPDKSAQGVLALLGDVAHSHGKKIKGIWNTEERKGDGKYNPLSQNVEGSNPFAATVWEGELLRKHFSPKVRDSVKLLEKSISQA